MHVVLDVGVVFLFDGIIVIVGVGVFVGVFLGRFDAR